MGRNKKWKRIAKKIRGECFQGCDYCNFLILDPYGYEDYCEFHFEDGECENVRILEKTVKGITMFNKWGEKIV